MFSGIKKVLTRRLSTPTPKKSMNIVLPLVAFIVLQISQSLIFIPRKAVCQAILRAWNTHVLSEPSEDSEDIVQYETVQYYGFHSRKIKTVAEIDKTLSVRIQRIGLTLKAEDPESKTERLAVKKTFTPVPDIFLPRIQYSPACIDIVRNEMAETKLPVAAADMEEMFANPDWRKAVSDIRGADIFEADSWNRKKGSDKNDKDEDEMPDKVVHARNYLHSSLFTVRLVNRLNMERLNIQFDENLLAVCRNEDPKEYEVCLKRYGKKASQKRVKYLNLTIPDDIPETVPEDKKSDKRIFSDFMNSTVFYLNSSNEPASKNDPPVMTLSEMNKPFPDFCEKDEEVLPDTQSILDDVGKNSVRVYSRDYLDRNDTSLIDAASGHSEDMEADRKTVFAGSLSECSNSSLSPPSGSERASSEIRTESGGTNNRELARKIIDRLFLICKVPVKLARCFIFADPEHKYCYSPESYFRDEKKLCATMS